MPHRERRGGEEVPVIHPALHRPELEVGLVHERRGLQRRTCTDPPAFAAADAPQVLVEEGEQLVGEDAQVVPWFGRPAAVVTGRSIGAPHAAGS